MIQRTVIKTVSGKTVDMGPLSPPVTAAQLLRALEQHHSVVSSSVVGADNGTFKAVVADPVEAPEVVS